ncbi:MAG: sirohydrochlorin chelatase [Actinomycetes bacterium]
MSRGLLLAAHGSHESAAQQSTERLAQLVRAELPGVTVAIGYLDHAEPSVSDALAALAREAETVTVVPLLFAPGKHVDVDLPAVVAAHPGVTLTAPLGPDPLVAAALRDRLIESETSADATVLVVSAGSNDPAAARSTEATARLLAEGTGWHVVATSANADIPLVVAEARSGDGTVAVSPLLLAPGSFAERIAAAAYAGGADIVAEPIADHPAIALLVAKRFAASTQVAA